MWEQWDVLCRWVIKLSLQNFIDLIAGAENAWFLEQTLWNWCDCSCFVLFFVIWVLFFSNDIGNRLIFKKNVYFMKKGGGVFNKLCFILNAFDSFSLFSTCGYTSLCHSDLSELLSLSCSRSPGLFYGGKTVSLWCCTKCIHPHIGVEQQNSQGV